MAAFTPLPCFLAFDLNDETYLFCLVCLILYPARELQESDQPYWYLPECIKPWSIVIARFTLRQVLPVCSTCVLVSFSTRRSRYYPAPGNWDTSNLPKTTEQVGRRVKIQTQLGLHIPVFCIFNEGRLFCFCFVSLQTMSFRCSVKTYWLPGYSASHIPLFLWKSQPTDLTPSGFHCCC